MDEFFRYPDETLLYVDEILFYLDESPCYPDENFNIKARHLSNPKCLALNCIEFSELFVYRVPLNMELDAVVHIVPFVWCFLVYVVV